MTADELEEQIARAVAGFCELEGMTEELAQSLVEQGYLSYDDLEVIEPDALQEMGGLTESQVELIVNQAEARARDAEVAASEERRRRKLEQVENELRAAAEADAAVPAVIAPAEPSTDVPEITVPEITVPEITEPEVPEDDGDAQTT